MLLLISGYTTATAQDSEFFRLKLGKPSKVIDENSELYEQKDITVRVAYDEEAEACSINIYAPATASSSGRGADPAWRRETFERMVALANELIPVSMRGTGLRTSSELGNCTDMRYEDTERALVLYNQNACYGQGVHVLFKRRSCPAPPDLPYLRPFFLTPRPQNTCAAAPSKGTLEGMFGFLTPMYPGLDGYFRFTKNNTSGLFKYGGDYRLDDLVIRGSGGIAQLIGVINQIVPQDDRGKFLERDASKFQRVRGQTYFEKYECLQIEYSEEYGSENTGYASVRVTWDRAQRH
jgi:hypothetical protein